MDESENAPHAAAPPEPTDVRFGMRGLLLTMTAVAVGTAALGSLLRGLAPGTRFEMATAWSACAIIVLGGVGYCARNRLRLERMAGKMIFSLTPRGRLGISARPWMIVLFGFLWIGGGLYFLAVMALDASVGPPGVRTPYPANVFPCVISGMLISTGIATIWWNRTVQLREHGVLRGLKLLRWTHITAHRWSASAVFFEGVDQRHRDVQLAAIVSGDKRDVVDRLLAQKLSARGRGLEVTTDNASVLKQGPLVPIRVGLQVSMRGMMSAFTFYVLLNVLLFAAFRPFGAPSGEFVEGAGIGIVGAIATLAYGSRRVSAAGAPLVRLLTRIDWPSMLVAVLLAFGCYYINQQLLFPPWYVAGVLGIGSGLAASAVAGMILRDKFDLCENGLMLIRWTFLPWARVRLVKWKRDGNGALVLRSAWRRVAAKVPREHRGVVDRVLREKLGAEGTPEFNTAANSGG